MNPATCSGVSRMVRCRLFRRVYEPAFHLPGFADLVDVESVPVLFIVECQLVRAAAVERGRVASQPLGLVDMPEASERHSRRVYRLRQDHHVLPCEECLPALAFASCYRVVRHQDAGRSLFQPRRLSHQDFVDQRGRVPVLRLCIRVRHESPQPPFVKSRQGEYLQIPAVRVERFDLRRGVDVEVSLSLRGLFQHTVGSGIVVVHGSEKQHHLAACPAERSEEFRDRVLDVLQRGVCPHPRPVEKVPGDDGHVRLFNLCRPRYRPHAVQRVLASGVLSVPHGAVQVPKV